jgi:hypothetical protein
VRCSKGAAATASDIGSIQPIVEDAYHSEEYGRPAKAKIQLPDLALF